MVQFVLYHVRWWLRSSKFINQNAADYSQFQLKIQKLSIYQVVRSQNPRKVLSQIHHSALYQSTLIETKLCAIGQKPLLTGYNILYYFILYYFKGLGPSLKKSVETVTCITREHSKHSCSRIQADRVQLVKVCFQKVPEINDSRNCRCNEKVMSLVITIKLHLSGMTIKVDREIDYKQRGVNIKLVVSPVKPYIPLIIIPRD